MREEIQHAVITGGTGSLGQAIAEALQASRMGRSPLPGARISM